MKREPRPPAAPRPDAPYTARELLRFARTLAVPMAVGAAVASLDLFVLLRLEDLEANHPAVLGIASVLCQPGFGTAMLLGGGPHSLESFVLLFVLSPLVTGASWFLVAWIVKALVARVLGNHGRTLSPR